MSTLTLRSTTPTRSALSFDLSAALTDLITLLSVTRQRAALARMDNAQLRDLGLTRAEADTEARRPFWDLPTHLS